MTINKKIKAAVIGLGVGIHHARTLNAHPNCELIWVCDFNKKKLEDVRFEFPKAKLTSNSRDIFNDENIDLVCIASHDEFHYPQVVESLNNNKHVFVEKPICMTSKEARDIKNMLKLKSNLRLSSNMVLRTCPLFLKVRKEVTQNILGDIYHIEADYFWGRKEKLISGWRAEANFYSIIHGAAVHMIDLIVWIVGKNPLTVKTLGNNISTKGTKQKHNDFAVLLLGFDNNMTVKISSHGGCIHPHFHSLKVFGKNSSFIHESTGTVWINSNKDEKNFIPENADYPAKKERNKVLISFIDTLLNLNKNVLVSDNEVFNTLSICLAAEQSSQTGKNVNIEYL